MYDIIADTPELQEEARKKGITPLYLEKDVMLVTSTQGLKEAKTIILASKPDRELLEAPIDGVVDLELNAGKDRLHYRSAGLDQVTAKILSKDRKALVLSLQALKDAPQPGIVLGRMLQNALVAKKAKAPVILASFATKPEELPTTHDLETFFKAVGVDEKLVKQSQKQFKAWAERASHRAGKTYIGEGIKKA